MTTFKNEMAGKVVKWQEGNIGTFTMEEILGENGITAMKIALAGYKAVKMSQK